jgi:PilZ domain
MTQGHDVKDHAAQRVAQRISAIRDLSVDYEGYSESIVTRPPDISTRGMFINTSRVFPEGAVLNVQFCLALSGVEIRSRAEVRYCLAGVGVGVEFVEISPESIAAIQHEIEMTNRQSAPNKATGRK